MSSMEEKLEREEKGVSVLARQLYYKHLHYRDGTPRFEVLATDGEKVPTLVKVLVMDEYHVWRRVLKADGDWWFEFCPDGKPPLVATVEEHVPTEPREQLGWGGKSSAPRYRKRQRKPKAR